MMPSPELDANHYSEVNEVFKLAYTRLKQRRLDSNATRGSRSAAARHIGHLEPAESFDSFNISGSKRSSHRSKADSRIVQNRQKVWTRRTSASVSGILLSLVIFCGSISFHHVEARRVTSVYDALIYLNNFGYLPSGQQAGLGYQVTRYEFSKALRRFQKMSNIKTTGHLDGETLKMMNVRRCANKDYERSVEGNTQLPHGLSSAHKDTISSIFGGLYESGPAKAIPAHYTMRSSYQKGFPPRSKVNLGRLVRSPLQPSFHTVMERYKRYAATRGWDKTTISWSVRELPPENSATAMTSSQIMGVIRSAFQLWSDGSSNILKFIEVPGDSPEPADIDIRFTSGVLPNGLIFDGPDGLASYSFYPTNPDFPGDIYFDAAEKWALRDEGINLKQVATQEIGHALGLAHSDDPNAVMWPFYVGYDENFRLGQDDIKGIKTLYGKAAVSGASTANVDSNQVETLPTSAPDVAPEAKQTLNVEPPRAPAQRPPQVIPPAVSRPHNQPITGVNSAITGLEGPTVLGPTADRGVGDRCEPGFVPDSITQIQDGRIFFTKNDNYWELRYDPEFGITVPSDYPKSLRNDWKLPDDAIPVDAMFTGLRGRTFVFKGNRYWRYTNLDLDPGYPRLVSVGFPGVPGNIEAAFVWPNDNRTYFVQGDNLYNYDRRRFPPLKPAKPLIVDNRQAKIDAAFYWRENRRTLVISGTQLVGLSNNDFKVADAFNFPATFLYACAEMANLYYGRPPVSPSLKAMKTSTNRKSATQSSAAYQTKVDFFRALNNSRLGLVS